MIILTKSVFSVMINFIFGIILACILIPILKSKKVDQRLSPYLEKTHKKKQGTPTMGGLIFLFSTIIIYFGLYLFNKVAINYNVLIVIITFIGYGIIGFIDDYLIIKRCNNKGLSETAKFLMQLFLAIIFFYLFMKAGNEPLLWIHSLNIKINIGWLYGVLILFILLASSNAVNITDGLDGLAGGLSIIAFISLGILTWNTGWLDGYDDIAIFIFLLVGGILAFLLFNTNPAKIFMGDTGSLALGATMGAVSILTRHELLLVVIGIVFVLETATCLIQRYYYKITHKRIFLMAPIHHTFEKIGWNERDIVKLFWVIGLLGSLFALGFGVWL
ncbi:MAG: phospho-N-acetylmuramoyl-pentapeptide-transferase [Bacilli bacterium]